MKHKIKIVGDIQRQHAIEMIKLLPLDVIHIIRIEEYKPTRNLEQNALHWKRLDIIRLHIADSTGQIFSAEDLHEFFKSKFLPAHIVEIGNESIKIVRTTTNKNTKEFSEFMDQIDRYCIERLNLFLPTREMMA